MGQRQVTCAPHGHMLTNAAVWSPDSRWIVYDVRSGVDGARFDGTHIERVDVETGRVEVLHVSTAGACCGVVTASPVDDRVVFIRGPERPTADWTYGPAHRQAAVVDARRPDGWESLDARDLVPPFTAGALRGGTHVHVFDGTARLVSFTYEDALLASPSPAEARPLAAGGAERNLRGVGVTLCNHPVHVPRSHPRNHDGSGFSVLVTRLTDDPRPGSDEICRAVEEAWVGGGYRRDDGTWQRHALAFQGDVVTRSGRTITEVFLVDLPDEPTALTMAGAGPLAGTATTRPAVPRDVRQRRLTFTADRPHPGIRSVAAGGPRHWLRSSPDGGRIGCLMADDDGIVQVFTVAPAGGELRQITRDPWPVTSAFSWSPDGGAIAYVADGSVMLVDASSGVSRRLTPRSTGSDVPRPEACVFAPDGRRIAFLRTLTDGVGRHNHVFTVDTR